MKLDSVGILIYLKPLGERDSVAHIYTYDYGIIVGLLRGAQIAKKNKPLIGQVGTVSWVARLDSQLGTFHWEANRNLAAALMANRDALEYMNCAFCLIDALLPEREKYDALYEKTVILLVELAKGDSLETCYLNWEVSLLQELGYALDFSCCSGCGKKENLNYLSPKTGRAVCNNCAAPYINRLYKLPLTLITTERFLEQVFNSQGGRLPMLRSFLIKKI